MYSAQLLLPCRLLLLPFHPITSIFSYPPQYPTCPIHVFFFTISYTIKLPEKKSKEQKKVNVGGIIRFTFCGKQSFTPDYVLSSLCDGNLVLWSLFWCWITKLPSPLVSSSAIISISFPFPCYGLVTSASMEESFTPYSLRDLQWQLAFLLDMPDLGSSWPPVSTTEGVLCIMKDITRKNALHEENR